MNCSETLVALALLAATSSVAMAQECRSLPRGSQERKACHMNDPAYQARREQCKQLARERGDTHKTGTGAGKMRDFVHDCMRGRQH
jgi:hypothetical protein